MPLGSQLLPLLILLSTSLSQEPNETVEQEAPVSQEVPAVEETPIVEGDVVTTKSAPKARQPLEQVSAWLGAVGTNWRPLDNPGAYTLHAPLLKLPGNREGLFESTNSPRLLLIRSLPVLETLIDGFMNDEEVMSRQGEFLPLEDRAFDGANGPTQTFDCEWILGDLNARVAALYAKSPTGQAYGLWILTTDETPFAELQTELEQTLERLRPSDQPLALPGYSAILNEHEVSFRLAQEGLYELLPVESMSGKHASVTQDILKANTPFIGSQVREWSDVARGVTLSMQLVEFDVNLGPESPFVYWLSGVYQTEFRKHIDLGDPPRQLLHWENARTQVMSDGDLERHYKNCERTLGQGIIIEVLLPRSPFARVVRVDSVRPQAGELDNYGRMWFVETRRYHLSRGEMVTGVSAVILHAEAQSKADLDALEQGLEFHSRPLVRAGRFPLPE